MVSPGRFISGRGCRFYPPRGLFPPPGVAQFGKRTRKPNSVYAVIPLGAALPRTLISDLPGGFGHCLTPLRRRPSPGAPLEPPFGAGPAPCANLAPGPRFPPYLVLLRVGFTLPPSLLPERCALTAPFHPYHCMEQPLGRDPPKSSDAFPKGCPTQWRYVFCGTSRPRVLKPASRTLSGTLPCGVRTFLPRQPLLAQGLPAATARSSCQCLVYRESGFTSCDRGFWRERLQPRRARSRISISIRNSR